MSLADSKPGESWTELDPPDDSTYSLPIFLSVGGAVLFSITCLSCGVHKLCRPGGLSGQGDTGSLPTVDYSVAVSNHMFRDEESGRLPPCLNCILIEMGEMACYQDCCPQCGRVPPSRLQAKIKYFKRNKGRSSRPCRQPAADGQDRLQVSARQAGPHNYPV